MAENHVTERVLPLVGRKESIIRGNSFDAATSFELQSKKVLLASLDAVVWLYDIWLNAITFIVCVEPDVSLVGPVATSLQTTGGGMPIELFS